MPHEPIATDRAARRELMARRDAALAAGDIAEFQRLTSEIAALPMKGVATLTQKDVARYTRKAGR